MALVLRKTITPKNVFFLKCMKGRKLSTAVYKKNTTPFFRNVTKRNNYKRAQRIKSLFLSKRKNIENEKILKFANKFHKNISCPNFSRHINCLEKVLTTKLKRTPSLLSKNMNSLNGKLLNNNMLLPNTLKRSLSTSIVSSAKCCCPAPCSCLPPPCNTPAKCIQYMTGYYYYPYGTWFCGPYHVSTGACGPCTGPMKPGGPCGPSPSCPGPCGPLCCCGVTLDGQNSPSNKNINTSDHWPMFYTNNYMGHPYMQYYYNNFPQTNQYGQYNPENFVPYTFPNPQTFDNQTKRPYSPTQIQDSSTKSSITWPPPQEPKIATVNQTASIIPNPSANQPIKNPFNKPNPYSPPPPFPYDSKPTLSKTNPFTKPKTNARTMLPPSSGGICYYTTKYISKNRNNIKVKPKKSIKGFSAEKLKLKKKIKNDWNIFEGKQNK